VSLADRVLDIPGAGVIVPDLVLKHRKNRREVFIEVLGFWSRDAVWKRIELAQRGLKRILLEGGAETVSRFLQAGCLDRLHLIVAPILMGSGRASLNLPAIEHMDQALRLNVRTHQLGNEVLFDCDLSPQRVNIA
jgi:riboflavin biosynthesis pyrimidine reductase